MIRHNSCDETSEQTDSLTRLLTQGLSPQRCFELLSQNLAAQTLSAAQEDQALLARTVFSHLSTRADKEQLLPQLKGIEKVMPDFANHFVSAVMSGTQKSIATTVATAPITIAPMRGNRTLH
jgi:hypothetical protein